MTSDSAHSAESVRWEYCERPAPSVEEMNELGRQGWELVTATAFSDGAFYIFKRRQFDGLGASDADH